MRGIDISKFNFSCQGDIPGGMDLKPYKELVEILPEERIPDILQTAKRLNKKLLDYLDEKKEIAELGCSEADSLQKEDILTQLKLFRLRITKSQLCRALQRKIENKKAMLKLHQAMHEERDRLFKKLEEGKAKEEDSWVKHFVIGLLYCLFVIVLNSNG